MARPALLGTAKRLYWEDRYREGSPPADRVFPYGQAARSGTFADLHPDVPEPIKE